MNNILEATFRVNPDYELMLFDRLPIEQQTLLEGLRKDPNFYGILRPRGRSAAGVKSVCCDTALLFKTLEEHPGPIPEYVRAKGEANQAVAQLVLDGILAMRRRDEWVTGAAAMELLDSAAQVSWGEGGRLGQLSVEALQYASALRSDQPALLAGRLYGYHTIPVSAHWSTRLPHVETLLRTPGLDKEWRRVEAAPPYDVWMAWQTRQGPSSDARRLGYKLYVSPHPNHVPEAFAALVSAASEGGARHFKVGKTTQGWLRPDKMVAYCESWEALQRVASLLAGRLEGCPAQGVPFTAELAGDGLLSWGADPAPDYMAPGWLQRESWRSRVTNLLGTALAVAKRNPAAGSSAWQFALQRVRLDGVDPETWCPLEVAK